MVHEREPVEILSAEQVAELLQFNIYYVRKLSLEAALTESLKNSPLERSSSNPPACELRQLTSTCKREFSGAFRTVSR